MANHGKKRQRPARLDPVYRAHNPELPTAVVFDMDGTLALLGGRNPYDAFHCDRDPIHRPVLAMADVLAAHYTLLIVSGRYEKFRPQTETWLANNAVQYAELLMRPDGDNRNDAIIKAEIFRDKIAPKYNVHCAFDDRDRVVAMWRFLGVPCFQVQEGNF